MKIKEKKSYPEDLKSLLGFSLPMLTYAFSGVIFGVFMQYLTDYSGIDEAMGKAGYAAAFGTMFLIVSRIIDAVDDPLQAWIMDSAKERPFGKYRLFTFVSLFLILIGIIAMFGIPSFVKGNAILLTIWIFAAYIIMEVGTAFNGVTPIVQKSTTEMPVRTKIVTWMRMFMIVGAIPATLYIPIATILNTKVNDLGKSVSISVIAIISIVFLISLIGIKLLHEPYRPKKQDGGDQESRVSFADIKLMLKTNKPMWIHNIGFVVGNAAYGFMGAMIVYFIKWYYTADVATGAVDNVRYASIYGLFGVLSLVTGFITPLLAGFAIKKIGTFDKTVRTLMLVASIGYLILFILLKLDLLVASPVLYIILNALVGLPVGMATIPFLLLNVEVADFAEYKVKKNMTATTTSVNNVIGKSVIALTTAINGFLLISVGYSVNSTTGAYAGDLSKIPSMINSFGLFVTLVPAVLCFGCWLIYKFLYPITPEIRTEMTEELQIRRKEAEVETN